MKPTMNHIINFQVGGRLSTMSPKKKSTHKKRNIHQILAIAFSAKNFSKNQGSLGIFGATCSATFSL